MNTRHGIKRVCGAFGALLVPLLLASCGSEGAGFDSPPPPGVATLGWEQATIDFPLERFEMSPTELSVVWAARNIALVRCLTGSNQVSDAEIGRSAAMLATPDMSRDALDWVFGRWSTEAIRSYGWQRSYSDFDAGRLTPSSDSALRGCISEPAILSLTPGGISFSVDGDTAFDKLSELYSESYQKTRQSPLAESLSRQMGDCLAENGYELARGDRDGQPAISVRLPENWTEEEQSRAVLASAACNDRIGLTQQLANLMAGYQEQIIAEHEAELVAIRVEVDRRLALAHEILREVGLE